MLEGFEDVLKILSWEPSEKLNSGCFARLWPCCVEPQRCLRSRLRGPHIPVAHARLWWHEPLRRSRKVARKCRTRGTRSAANGFECDETDDGVENEDDDNDAGGLSNFWCLNWLL